MEEFAGVIMGLAICFVAYTTVTSCSAKLDQVAEKRQIERCVPIALQCQKEGLKPIQCKAILHQFNCDRCQNISKN